MHCWGSIKQIYFMKLYFCAVNKLQVSSHHIIPHWFHATKIQMWRAKWYWKWRAKMVKSSALHFTHSYSLELLEILDPVATCKGYISLFRALILTQQGTCIVCCNCNWEGWSWYQLLTLTLAFVPVQKLHLHNQVDWIGLGFYLKISHYLHNIL